MTIIIKFKTYVNDLYIFSKNAVMKRKTPISEIMTRKVVTLNNADSLETAELLFKRYKIRHIPVVEGESIIGMLSFSDLLRISFADAIDDDEESVDTIVYNMFTIEQVMAKKLVSVSPTDTVKHVAEILSEKEFHAIPVVEGTKLVGIVATTDLINFLLEKL